jgi:hypothetical protein
MMSEPQSTVPESFLWALLQQAYPELALLRAASNIETCGGNPAFTLADFMAFYPRFGLIPPTVVNAYIALANANLSYGRWASRWTFGICYYVAHYCTLWAQTMTADPAHPTSIGQDGMSMGLLTTEKMEDVEFHYDHKALIDTSWGQFNATEFGRLFVQEAKLVGTGGMYVV